MVRAEVDHGTAELVEDPDRPRSWTLLVDGTSQSHVDLDDPTHLEFEYVRRLGHVLDTRPPGPLRVLHLGGGAWTLPRYVAATRPGSPQRIVELDGALAALVADCLPAEELDGGVHVEDARAALEATAAGTADAVVLDVFAGSRIPAHLTTVQCVRAAARALAPGGLYAANVADAVPLAFARGQVAAFTETFAHVAVVVAPSVLHGPRFGNLILLGSDALLPDAALVRRLAADPFPARLLDDAQARAFAGDAAAPTDRTAAPSPLPPPGFFGRPG
ncbi:spermidine synthase [Pseudonocardia sp.]|uniref:spermidine synthase n=1 Tax=Pseudonocardia sp. TaxID=60912 RepID=UPI003D0AFAF3